MLQKMISAQDFLYKKNRQQQIKGFYYVARHGSISGAAKAMNLTQSTVSLQIISLERDLGFKLFNRVAKKVELTKEGEEFYRVACPLMQEFESVLDKFLNKKTDTFNQTIDIAAHHVAISYLLPSLISEFKKVAKNVKFVLRNLSQKEALERLRNGEIDLAVYPNIPYLPEIKVEELVSYKPLLIINKSNPISKISIKDFSDLRKVNLIRIDKKLITLQGFEEVFQKLGLNSCIEFENGNWEILKKFVKSGDYSAVVSEICIDENDDDLTTKDLSKFFPNMTYSLCSRKGSINKNVVEEFSNFLFQKFKR